MACGQARAAGGDRARRCGGHAPGQPRFHACAPGYGKPADSTEYEERRGRPCRGRRAAAASCALPEEDGVRPVPATACRGGAVVMTVDEYEAIRLIGPGRPDAGAVRRADGRGRARPSPASMRARAKSWPRPSSNGRRLRIRGRQLPRVRNGGRLPAPRAPRLPAPQVRRKTRRPASRRIRTARNGNPDGRGVLNKPRGLPPYRTVRAVMAAPHRAMATLTAAGAAANGLWHRALDSRAGSRNSKEDNDHG